MAEHKLQPLSPHIHWLPPYAPTDRPVLGIIQGTRDSLLVDAGASAAHVGLLRAGLATCGLRGPTLLHLTHWHWDHVFGTGSLDLPAFAHVETCRIVGAMAELAWDDAALDARVAAGTEIAFCRDMIRAELPDRSGLVIRPPRIGFSDQVVLDLGGVTAVLAHVGGDHAADSSVAFVPADRVVFLGDCLSSSIYGGPRHYSVRTLLPLLADLLAFDAAVYLAGHDPEPITREALVAWAARLAVLAQALDRYGADRRAVVAAVSPALAGGLKDDDLEDLDLLLQGIAVTSSGVGA
jgi:glyoxylase-like metal-dependent hydrolase (beta-lactamase superfamily II)